VRLWVLVLGLLAWGGLRAVAAPQPICIVVASIEGDPNQYNVLRDVMADLVSERAQLNLDGKSLPIVILDAGRHSHEAALQRLGIDASKLPCVGVCRMQDGRPDTMLTLQGPVTKAEASVSVSMRRVQFLLGLQGITADLPQAIAGDRMHVSYRFEKDGRVRTMQGSILTPLDLWNELAMLQPPPDAHGPYGLPLDDALWGQRGGFGYRQLGRLGRTYLRFDSFQYTQPKDTDRIGLQTGNYSDPYRLSDTSLGAFVYDLRPRIEADLRAHLHLGTP
jgi:hypothetical protein